MKKLLALLLSLLLCLSFVVSCNREEEISSSSSEEPSSESSSEKSSSSEEISSSTDTAQTSSEESSNKPTSSEPYPPITERDLFTELTAPFPIYPRPEDAYDYYRIFVKPLTLEVKHLDRWVFNDRESLKEALSKLVSFQYDALDESLFVDNFAIVVYREDDPRHTENYSYHSLSKERYDNFYLLDFEYTTLGEKAYNENVLPEFIDLILIPRSDFDENDVFDSRIRLRITEHIVKTDVKYSN